MSLSIVLCRAQQGLSAPLVKVEVHLSNGLPGFSMVGLPEAAVREAKDRVRSALLNSRFEFPARRITVNLAPADLPKEGTRFDLAIAIGILMASNQAACADLGHYEFISELALSGELRAVKGVLPGVMAAAEQGRAVLIAPDNSSEAGLVRYRKVYAADHLTDVVRQLNGDQFLRTVAFTCPDVRPETPDLSAVHGQAHAKRALTVAAAGGHSMLMLGPPGTGKTMLASRLPGILPALDERASLEVAAIKSLTGSSFDCAAWAIPPFRSPHHSSSSVALTGGGRIPQPGEISLAHHGVLFLDELPEFSRSALEQLREPLESGEVNISRANHKTTYPASFQLIAAMNACPCGWLGDPRGRCCCSASQIERYRKRVSGPLLDRIDLQVEVPPVPREVLQGRTPASQSSAALRRMVQRARTRQISRNGSVNSQLKGGALEKVCQIDASCLSLIDQAMDRLGLSARAYHRILRVARTIADLEGEAGITPSHIGEAIGYRLLDRCPA